MLQRKLTELDSHAVAMADEINKMEGESLIYMRSSVSGDKHMMILEGNTDDIIATITFAMNANERVKDIIYESVNSFDEITKQSKEN